MPKTYELPITVGLAKAVMTVDASCKDSAREESEIDQYSWLSGKLASGASCWAYGKEKVSFPVTQVRMLTLGERKHRSEYLFLGTYGDTWHYVDTLELYSRNNRLNAVVDRYTDAETNDPYIPEDEDPVTTMFVNRLIRAIFGK